MSSFAQTGGAVLQLIFVNQVIQVPARWLATKINEKLYTEAQRSSADGRIRSQLHFRLFCVLFLMVYVGYTVINVVQAQPPNAYKLLHLPVSSTSEELKSAYRRLSVLYHPDKNPSPNAQEEYMRFRESFELLNTPTRRKVHDLLGPQAFVICPTCSSYRDYFMATLSPSLISHAVFLGMMLLMNWLSGQGHTRVWILIWFANVISIDLTATVREQDALWFADYFVSGFTIRDKIIILASTTPSFIMIMSNLHDALFPTDAISLHNGLLQLDLLLDQERSKTAELSGIAFRATNPTVSSSEVVATAAAGIEPAPKPSTTSATAAKVQKRSVKT